MSRDELTGKALKRLHKPRPLAASRPLSICRSIAFRPLSIARLLRQNTKLCAINCTSMSHFGAALFPEIRLHYKDLLISASLVASVFVSQRRR